MTYIYSLYDPETNELMHRGTPAQLVEKGLYKTLGAVSAVYRAQTDGAKPQRWRIERETEEGRRDNSLTVADRLRGAATELPQGRSLSQRKGDKSLLAQDVHWLCRYNQKAKKRGCRELSYGQWAAAGKPDEPV